MIDWGGLASGAAIAAIVSAACSYALRWARQRYRFALAAAAIFLAWMTWHAFLGVSSGDNLDVDNPVLLGLSGEDVGTGVLGFLIVAMPLGLTRERQASARDLTALASIAAAAAIVVDRFL